MNMSIRMRMRCAHHTGHRRSRTHASHARVEEHLRRERDGYAIAKHAVERDSAATLRPSPRQLNEWSSSFHPFA